MERKEFLPGSDPKSTEDPREKAKVPLPVPYHAIVDVGQLPRRAQFTLSPGPVGSGPLLPTDDSGM